MANTELIKKLRESTGCGMSDCNKALKECGDDYDKSVEWLRKKGLSSAAKKSSRIASEGVIGIMNNGNISSVVEINSETDFVARNEKFQSFAKDVLRNALSIFDKDESKYVEALKESQLDNEKLNDALTHNIAIIGENIQIRRGKTIKQDGGLIVSYIHNAVIDGLGKIGVLVSLKSKANKEKLSEFGKGIAMHIAAAKPEFLSEKDVPESKLENEKDIARELAKKTGKPDAIVEKMVEGRVKKFFEESVLLNQIYVIDGEKKISELLKDFEKENSESVEIAEYVLYVLGEGIEKKEVNFTDEVASIIGETQ
ncbi:MAG: translation elongation factor Ts [Rickettsiales bacterium]|jgi:elongation factor Ts|nr:translation elongation factor Ts [Rickettsiales bacterium]